MAVRTAPLGVFLSETSFVGVQTNEVEHIVLGNCQKCRSTLGISVSLADTAMLIADLRSRVAVAPSAAAHDRLEHFIVRLERGVR
jgi:hypothetical protein